jgi:hypothetical protein
MSTVRSMSRRQAIACALLAVGVVALVIAAFIGYRAYERMRSQPPPIPGEVDVERIEPWMTLRYVAHVYRVPEPDLYRAVGADPDWGRDLSLAEVAGRLGQPPETLVSSVRGAVRRFRESRPPPAGGTPHP